MKGIRHAPIRLARKCWSSVDSIQTRYIATDDRGKKRRKRERERRKEKTLLKASTSGHSSVISSNFMETKDLHPYLLLLLLTQPPPTLPTSRVEQLVLSFYHSINFSIVPLLSLSVECYPPLTADSLFPNAKRLFFILIDF